MKCADRTSGGPVSEVGVSGEVGVGWEMGLSGAQELNRHKSLWHTSYPTGALLVKRAFAKKRRFPGKCFEMIDVFRIRSPVQPR